MLNVQNVKMTVLCSIVQNNFFLFPSHILVILNVFSWWILVGHFPPTHTLCQLLLAVIMLQRQGQKPTEL